MNPSAPAAWAPPTPDAGGADREARTNPYVGPRALRFGETIHGRAREIADIRGLLMAHRIVLLYSPSGAGKTSLIEAGLRPEMEQRGFTVLPTIRVGHELTTGDDHSGHNRYCSSVIASLEERLAPEDQLTPDQVAGADLEEYLQQLADAEPDRNWCLFFDQFEELVTMNPADVEAKEAFLKQLGAALKDRHFWVLIAMREDFIAYLDPHVDLLPTRLKTRYRLDLLSPEAAKEAARAPAEATGVEFEQAAVDRLIDDLRQIRVQHLDGTTVELGPHVEPLQLQIVCRRLWTPTTTAIRVADLDNLGGVDEALTLYYHDALDRTVRRTSVRERTLRSWFESDLITTDGFRRPVREGPGKSRGGAVLNELEEAYLVRKDRRNGTDWYELTHDRIVEPIRDSNEAYRHERRRRRRWIGAIAAAIAVVIGVAVIVSLANNEERRLSATEADIPSQLEVPRLEPGGFARFLIRPEEGDIITATLTATPTAQGDLTTSAKLRLVRVVDRELDAELASDSLRVIGVEGQKNTDPVVSSAADAEGPDNTAVTERAITAQDQTMVVEISTQSGGSFDLEIDRVDRGAGDAAPTPVLGVEPVDGGVEAAGVVANYVIEDGMEGTVRLTVRPVDESENGFDPVLTLDGGAEPVVQDVSGPGQAEVLVTRLEPDTPYVLAVSGYESSTGDFTVLLEPVTTTSLEIGADAVEGRVADPDGIVTYLVNDPDGGDVRLVVTPRDGSVGGLDPVVIVRDQQIGAALGSDQGGGGEVETVVAVLPADTEFMVDVFGFEGSTGDFVVTLERIDPTPLDLDAPVAGSITDPEDVTYYAVTVPAGVEIDSLQVNPSPDLDVIVDLSTPFGNVPIDERGTGQAEALYWAQFDVGAFPDDQRWLISVSSSDGSVGDYEIAVTSTG